jgi:predicted ABC-type ATPase
LCKEYVNADEIAKGLSPFQPEKVAIQAGRIMIQRVNELIEGNQSFAFETTLSSKNYLDKISRAKENGFKVTLFYFWLKSVDLAKERVRIRVQEGGHNIQEVDIVRRYERGLENLFKLYLPLVHKALIFDNSYNQPIIIGEKFEDGTLLNYDEEKMKNLR